MLHYSTPRFTALFALIRYTKFAALGVTMSVVTVASAHAQRKQMSPEMQKSLSSAMAKMLSRSLTNFFNRKVRITPALTEIDPKTQTVTLELLNPSDDTLNATLSSGVVPPAIGLVGDGAVGNTKTSAQSEAGALLADTTTNAKAPAMDSVASEWSLASWVQDLPSHIQLAPHEKKSVTIHVKIPSNLKSGEYAAWVVATTEVSRNAKLTATKADEGGTTGGIGIKSGSSMNISFGGTNEKPSQLQGGAKLVYRAGQ